LGQTRLNPSRSASTREQDERLAVNHIAEQLQPVDDLTVLVFCSSRYDLSRLNDALRQAFPGEVLGCTSAGLIGHQGFQRGGMTAIGLSKSAYRVEPYLIKPLSDCNSEIATLAQKLKTQSPDAFSAGKTFGILLVDGLSQMEEKVVSALDEHLSSIPVVGGSAGDDLRLRETHVIFGGGVHTDAAAFAFVTTDVPFELLHVHHFVPGQRKIEITSANSNVRTIYEINHETAALAYADLVNVSMADLNPNVFSRHPLLVEHGGRHFVRSIQRVNGDGSLTLYSAIDGGHTAWIGEPREPLTVLTEAFDSLPEPVREPSLVIGFDCVLRRLEFEQKRLDAAVGRFLSERHVVGFCTYGEQYDNLHMNQTFTGVALKSG